jgi:hypothetical protein
LDDEHEVVDLPELITVAIRFLVGLLLMLPTLHPESVSSAVDKVCRPLILQFYILYRVM